MRDGLIQERAFFQFRCIKRILLDQHSRRAAAPGPKRIEFVSDFRSSADWNCRVNFC